MDRSKSIPRRLGVVISRRPKQVYIELLQEVLPKLNEHGDWRVFMDEEAQPVVDLARELNIKGWCFPHIEMPKPWTPSEHPPTREQILSRARIVGSPSGSDPKPEPTEPIDVNPPPNIRRISYPAMVDRLLGIESPWIEEGVVINNAQTRTAISFSLMMVFLAGGVDAIIAFPSSGTELFLRFAQVVNGKLPNTEFPRCAFVDFSHPMPGLDAHIMGERTQPRHRYFPCDSLLLDPRLPESVAAWLLDGSGEELRSTTTVTAASLHTPGKNARSATNGNGHGNGSQNGSAESREGILALLRSITDPQKQYDEAIAQIGTCKDTMLRIEINSIARSALRRGAKRRTQEERSEQPSPPNENAAHTTRAPGTLSKRERKALRQSRGKEATSKRTAGSDNHTGEQ